MSTELSPKGGGSAKKKAGNKKIAPGNNDDTFKGLERDPALGMNPRAILTGLYGSRGERIRHTVHDGALQMPREALEIIREARAETGVSAPTEYELPGLDTVLRPCMDPALLRITVTELCATKVAVPQPTPPPKDVTSSDDGEQSEQIHEPKTVVNVLRTLAENRTIDRSFFLQSSSGDTTSRIRGGGEPETNPTTAQENVTPVQLPNQTANTTTHPVPVQAVASTAGAPLSVPQNTSVPPATMNTSASQPDTDTPMMDATPQVIPPQIQPKPPTPVLPTVSAATTPPVAPSINLPTAGGIEATKPITDGSRPESAPVITAVAPAAVKATTTLSGTILPPKVLLSVPPPGAGPTSKLPAEKTPKPGAAVKPPMTAVVSATVSSTAVPKSVLPQPAKLEKQPAPQFEQLKPGPNDETISPADTLTPKPSWYKKDRISDLERTMLPEWFDASSTHRTPASYIMTREKVIHMADELANRNVTNALIRRSVVGDAGSLHRLRSFLVHWGLINEDGINDSAATPAALRQDSSAVKRVFDSKRRFLLLQNVVEQSKRRKLESSSDMVVENATSSVPLAIDWKEIAVQMGQGASASECEKEFLTMPLGGAGTSSESNSAQPNAGATDSQEMVSDDASGLNIEQLRQKVFSELVEKSNPKVVSVVVQSALQATENNIPEAQNAALLGLVTSRALEHARSQEAAVSSTLSELVIQRLEKLENRMALMDDIEGILEAERVALELERRDLYTARCRHWFGGS